jgi:hypothetical protein
MWEMRAGSSIVRLELKLVKTNEIMVIIPLPISFQVMVDVETNPSEAERGPPTPD